MRLAHLHLPNITPFNTVSQIQQILTLRHVAYKKTATAAAVATSSATISIPPPPDSAIITFTPNPVYTTGRRDLPPSNTSSPSDTQPSIELSLPPSLEPIRHLLYGAQWRQPGDNYINGNGYSQQPPRAEYHPTLRGGQTTYHGPGQLVAYIILDLRRLGLSPRCHIRLLENTVIDLLAKYGVRGFTTADPGVWVNAPVTNNNNTNRKEEGEEEREAKKITAVGVHLRRHISSYGVGLNVTQEPMWFFKQIVACGLEGKEAISLEGLGVDIKRGPPEEGAAGSDVMMREVADGFVDAFVNRLRNDFPVGSVGRKHGEREEVEGVYEIGVKDVLELE